jgi:hypothetical protein
MVAEADLAEPYGLQLSFSNSPNYFTLIIDVKSRWITYRLSMMKYLVLWERIYYLSERA